ncbi:MAG TPA: hypothetical protein VEB63_02790 [Chitinophagaceae bacterium]|nr:hypothetical protein [Chitinophagaceae bacterium]
MDQNMISLIVAVVAMLVSFYTFYLTQEHRKKMAAVRGESFSSRPLQLQAYERLVLLAERISLPSIISRANQQHAGLEARQMQVLLIESIKQEFEYNTSQQIYVSPTAWEAIRNLRDQNIYMINQVGSTLPEGSTGTDLNRRLLEYLMNSRKSTLHEVVLEALNFEAKKIMR